MKEWFKARNAWGAAFLALSDAEAGRLAKALWKYTMAQELPNLSGAEKASFAMFQAQLEEDDKDMSELSEKRRTAGSKGGKQTQANRAIARFAGKIEANQPNADNKNKNKKQNEDDDGENAGARAEWLTDDEVRESLARDAAIEEAARSVGLTLSEAGMMRGRKLAHEYGLQKLLEAIWKSVDAPRWAYVEGVLRNGTGNQDDRGTGGGGAPSGRAGQTESAYSFLRDGIISG